MGECIGIGSYWDNDNVDNAVLSEILQFSKCLKIQDIASFLVIDFARLVDGKIIIIEFNDGQESGYSGVNPKMMWLKIIESAQQGDAPEPATDAISASQTSIPPAR